jgi:hypothetical protein
MAISIDDLNDEEDVIVEPSQVQNPPSSEQH